jgi:DNA-binding MarR family transcriptional regulator
MPERITSTLHHLVSVLDAYADAHLQSRHGVSFPTFYFLAAAADVEPVDITTLARCLAVTKAAVSKRVPALVADGWITTSGDPHHGRRVLISLTPAARELVRVAGGELEDAFGDLFTHPRVREAGLDPAAFATHLSLLIGLVEEKGLPA